MPLRTYGDFVSLDTSMPPPLVAEFPVGLHAPQPVEALEARLVDQAGPVAIAPGFAPSANEGGVIPIPPARIPSAPEMLRDDWGSIDGGTALVQLRPLLDAPPWLLAEIAPEGVRALRPYQVEAVRALLAQESVLLADDAGTGKTTAACAAMAALFQGRHVRGALVLCPPGRLYHWAAHLKMWAPGLAFSVVMGNSQARAAAWRAPARLYLADYAALAADQDRDDLRELDWHFDLLILDQVQAVIRWPSPPLKALMNLRARRRWGLAGGPPHDTEDWLALLRVLFPDSSQPTADVTLSDLRQRLAPHLLRRTKDELADQMPRRLRQELWVDLEEPQFGAYQAALAEERHRLAKLGSAVTRTHIAAAVRHLNRVCNFVEDTLDGPKVRALLDLVEEITAGGGKVIVFSQFREEGLARLLSVLQAYGAVLLEADLSDDERHAVMQAMRDEPDTRVLLADIAARTDGQPLDQASYLIHFDLSWNPALRLRAERRFHPGMGPGPPLTIYELWAAGTFEERLHRLLEKHRLLPGDIPMETRPADLDERISVQDWLREILEVDVVSEMRRKPISRRPGSGVLPSTSLLKNQLNGLSPQRLMEGVAAFMEALGFSEVEALREPGEKGGDLLVWREGPEGVERVMVRCMRGEKDVGVGQARRLMKAMKKQGDCLGAYLVSTSGFTRSCRKFADESEGRLALVAGAELYRHLHILGWF